MTEPTETRAEMASICQCQLRSQYTRPAQYTVQYKVHSTPALRCRYLDLCTRDDEAAGWPGVVHGHAEVDLPLAGSYLHGPDEGGGVAGDGHGARHPPGEDEHRVPAEWAWWRGGKSD